MSNTTNRGTDVENIARPPLLSIALLSIAFALALLTAWFPTMEHLSDPAWREHQRFHAFREIYLASIFGVTGIVLCLGPLRLGDSRALKIVGILGLGVVGGFWAGLPITGIGKSGMEPYINHGLQLFALATGYLIARSAIRKSLA